MEYFRKICDTPVLRLKVSALNVLLNVNRNRMAIKVRCIALTQWHFIGKAGVICKFHNVMR